MGNLVWAEEANRRGKIFDRKKVNMRETREVEMNDF